MVKMEDSTIKREVKTEPEDDSNDGVCADVFGVTVKSEETFDEGILVNPDLLAEEEELKQKGEEEYKVEVAKEDKDGELNKMSDEERYEKLRDLLNQSKQYSDWLKTKMEQSENDRAKELQARKEADKGKGNKRRNSTATRNEAKKK